ncbi:unnamed protein product [Rotaria magnacalcarata]|uniref:Centrosomal protein of 131 kDa n=11 Tax=Rotaria magnacalcarata TaxID=392030 RepID=A0A819MBW5_9BILA|nr:unnamed protein product [Rotaria magnacalcarata]CAF3977412.1 unnamed protein product [Rotaria magnacalcarata]
MNDNNNSRRDDAFDLTLHGYSIKPGTISSRSSSARSDSQSKQSEIVRSRPPSARLDCQPKEPETISSRPPSARLDSQSNELGIGSRPPSARLDSQLKELAATSSRPSSARSDSQWKPSGIVTSRPTSAKNDLPSKESSIASGRSTSSRSDTQSNGSQTPTRDDNTKERRPSLTSSVNFSSARKRRLSNSSQRSIPVKSPIADAKKSTNLSTSSSIFRVLSPHQQDADGFFTDESQKKSFEPKPDEEDCDDTRRWIDEINQLNSSFTPPPDNHTVGPMGMSRDSLNGTMTMTGANIFQANDHRRDRFLPIAESCHSEQVIPTGVEKASITIQQEPTDPERFEQTNPTEYEQQRELRTPIETQQEMNNNGLNNRQLSSGNSTPTNRKITATSSVPLLSNMDQKIRYESSVASSSSSSTPVPKVRIGDVYESLSRLEEVEPFPEHTSIEHNSIHILDPTSIVASPFIDELSPRTSNHVSYVSNHFDETNQDDRFNESARSQKSGAQEASSPPITRFTIPAQSDRRQQSKKLAQSVSIPHHHSSSSIDQQTRYATKIITPYKSLTMSPYEANYQDNEFQNSNKTTHDAAREKRLPYRIDYEEKQRQSTIVQPRMNQQHESSFHLRNNLEQDFDFHFQRQKDEYESIIQRHLKFIDQLIDDKKKLSHRCELLLYELKTIDKKYNSRIRSIEESHCSELQKLKDVHEAAEKLRRERWIEEKTKKIKELTVRGLEPEIQKLISKHKNELSKMKTVHEAELVAADERASQRYIRMVDELRDQLQREKDVAIADERELAREKYEKSLREEVDNLNEQRRRLYTEIEEEKSQQSELVAKQHADLEKLRRDIEENHRSVVESSKLEYEAIRLEQEHRHSNEIQELKDRLTLEKQNWEENLMKQQETLLASKERELREQMKHERDKEIEKIISQFESDTTTTKEETERTAESRVKRIRDKYEAEFHELENSEKQTRERFNQIKAQMTEFQGDNERLQVLLRQRETEINDIKKITETLQQERDRLSDIIRQEFADRLVLTEDENRRVKGEIAELRARQQLELEKRNEELEALKRQQDKELQALHEKIKQAISKKDEQVRGLHVQYETAVKRVEHLEGLLAQQRKLIATIPSSGSSALRKLQHS